MFAVFFALNGINDKRCGWSTAIRLEASTLVSSEERFRLEVYILVTLRITSFYSFASHTFEDAAVPRVLSVAPLHQENLLPPPSLSSFHNRMLFHH